MKIEIVCSHNGGVSATSYHDYSVPHLPACCRQVLPPFGHGRKMIDVFDFEDDGEMEGISKTSRYQVLTAARRVSHRKKRLWGYLERSEMKNPVYYREKLGTSFAGIKRVVTEYLPAGAARWQLDPFPHDENETQKLSNPPMGVATLGRERITSGGKQRRVTNPKSKDNEPTPVPGKWRPTD